MFWLIYCCNRAPVGCGGVGGRGELQLRTATLGVDRKGEGVVVGAVKPRVERNGPAVVGLNGREVGQLGDDGVYHSQAVGWYIAAVVGQVDVGPVASVGYLYGRVGYYLSAACGLDVEHCGDEAEVVRQDCRVDKSLVGLLAGLATCYALAVLFGQLGLAATLVGRGGKRVAALGGVVADYQWNGNGYSGNKAQGRKE